MSKVSRKKASGLRKSFISSLGRDLNEIALTLLEKDLDAVVHGGEAETEEIGLETVEVMDKNQRHLI